MRNFLIIFWGIFAAFTTVATFYVLINYEVQRWKDKQRQREGIYIRRVTRLEALITIFTPVFPCAMFAGHIFFDPESASITIDITALLVSAIFVAYLRYVHVAYVKISSEGVEQRIWFSNPTRYPFNAINRVVYYEKPDIDEPDMVGFYAKSGFQIALFDPITHNNYRLLAIVRFRIENKRWPDMTNPEDVAKVDILDKRGMTISYFKGLKKVTSLADVDM
ncbi:hypothetical protein HMPREF2999_04085 [Rothia sp. HMSC066H02]|uniref:hypothetical protein n=1 Tax=unclassified Rothia (in: high G+C Gram-positive bacteria) TaxID=2689056 RepID=UPI0008A4C6DE|nr:MULTISPECIES: hypothetical protein [unclassified Rothia (in: high G+C Gram-positive bacteria)]OFO94641.1 hypothetical protein HMPREF3008_03755 [Rothia sp. HMSC065D09]OFP12155.1 hypothetical protein HMPREF2999_04085 [Rothia sp. HMSC066H02]